MLSTAQARARWFKIMDRARIGKIDKADVLHFAPKLELDLSHCSDLFDRLDRDHDGYLELEDWDRIAAMIAYESLVRAETHPMYCAYFKMQKLQSLPRDRLREILTAKGLDPAMLDKPDEMLPLGPGSHSNKPGPPGKLEEAAADSSHLLAAKPRYRVGPDSVDLPPVPFSPAFVRPVPRLHPQRTAPIVAMQPGKWPSLVVQGIDEDRPGPLRCAMGSPIFEVDARVCGGHNGGPFKLGPAFSFFSQRQLNFLREEGLDRLQIMLQGEKKFRLEHELATIRHNGTRHLLHTGAPHDPSRLVFSYVRTGDTLLHLCARAFSPECALVLLRANVDCEAVNDNGETAVDLFADSLSELEAAPLVAATPLDSKEGSRAGSHGPTPRDHHQHGGGGGGGASAFAGGVGGGAGGHLTLPALKPKAAKKKGGGGGIPEEAPYGEGDSRIEQRWRERKRGAASKIGCLCKFLEELIRRLDGNLEAVSRIREQRLKFVKLIGTALTPAEQQRLDAADGIAALLRTAHLLLDRALHVDPAKVAAPCTWSEGEGILKVVTHRPGQKLHEKHMRRMIGDGTGLVAGQLG